MLAERFETNRQRASVKSAQSLYPQGCTHNAADRQQNQRLAYVLGGAGYYTQTTPVKTSVWKRGSRVDVTHHQQTALLANAVGQTPENVMRPVRQQAGSYGSGRERIMCWRMAWSRGMTGIMC